MTLREALEEGGRVSVFLLKLPGKEIVVSVALDRRTAEFVAGRVGLEIDERLVNIDPQPEKDTRVLSEVPRSGGESK